MLSMLRGTVLFLALATNTLAVGLGILTLVPLKFLLPFEQARRQVSQLMLRFGEVWIGLNSWGMTHFLPTLWQFDLPGRLERDKSYLVISNHVSWVDIFVLQKVFYRRIPFIRFFIKQQLAFVPLLGAVWWALDFPFMRRHSKEFLAKNPDRRDDDLKTIRKVCTRFRTTPVSILNFLEGTRWTPQKHAAQDREYRNLLKPKVGGVTFVLEAMGEQFASVLDVTLKYSEPKVTFWALLSGRIRHITAHVRTLDVPSGQALERDQIQAWLQAIWREKDQRLDVSLEA